MVTNSNHNPRVMMAKIRWATTGDAIRMWTVGLLQTSQKCMSCSDATESPPRRRRRHGSQRGRRVKTTAPRRDACASLFLPRGDAGRSQIVQDGYSGSVAKAIRAKTGVTTPTRTRRTPCRAMRGAARRSTIVAEAASSSVLLGRCSARLAAHLPFPLVPPCTSYPRFSMHLLNR
jgi:hypothetical protein